MRYEDFVSGNLAELERYTGLTLSNAPKKTGWTGHVVRSLKSDQWKDWFTDYDIPYYRDHFDEYICRLGYDESWTLNKTPKISRSQSIDYIIDGAARRIQEVKILTTPFKSPEFKQNLDFLQESALDGFYSSILKLGKYWLRSGRRNPDMLYKACYWLEYGARIGCAKCAVLRLKLYSAYPENECSLVSLDSLELIGNRDVN